MINSPPPRNVISEVMYVTLKMTFMELVLVFLPERFYVS
jgi:hypothetical protein